MPSPLISVIDDDELFLQALAGLLRSLGFETRTYSSAEEFMRSGACEASRCVITDIQMPGLSGIDLKRQLDDRHCVVPVVMITARAEARLHKQALESGAFCLLRKPFKASDLIECVGKAMSRKPVPPA